MTERFQPVERFLTFLQIVKSHTGQNLAACLSNYLASQSINFMDCRGQSYDNASNMSGHYGGMQPRLKLNNPLAVYIPCMANSLNLVVVNSVDCVCAASFLLDLFSGCINFGPHLHTDGLYCKNP